MALTGTLVMVWDLIALGVGAALVAGGQLGFAPALISIATPMSSFGPVLAVANLGTNLQQTLACGERVLELLDEEPVVREISDGVDVADFDGAAMQRVDFSYADDENDGMRDLSEVGDTAAKRIRVLDDVSLEVEPGSIVRIAGRSGAGKSTLLKLFMRFWDADNGLVEISDRDIRRINTPSLRAAEGFMAQETFLIDGTIRENLLLARPDATEYELRFCLEKASLSEFVDRLPLGMDTPLGDLGDSLSGGERQRLGLARVFLHDAPFVLLDEPTSNLDSLNEAAILRALSENRDGKTILLVSHRPSAAAIADTTYSVERAERAS